MRVPDRPDSWGPQRSTTSVPLDGQVQPGTGVGDREIMFLGGTPALIPVAGTVVVPPLVQAAQAYITVGLDQDRQIVVFR